MQDQFDYIATGSGKEGAKEFADLPPEFRALPPEISFRNREDNDGTVEEIAGEVNGNSGIDKSLLIKLLSGTLTTVGVTGFFSTAETNPPPVYLFKTGGTAQFEENSSVVELTRFNEFSIGGIWSEVPIPLDAKLQIDFDMKLSSTKEEAYGFGADGLAVAFSDNPYGKKIDSGGELGYSGLFGTEFDMLYNPPEETPGGRDYASGHIGIIGDTVWNHLDVSEQLQLENVDWKHVSVIYDKGILTTCYEGVEYASADVGKLMDQGQPLYVGITAATGSGTCYQAIDHVKINGTEIEIKQGNLLTEDNVIMEQ